MSTITKDEVKTEAKTEQKPAQQQGGDLAIFQRPRLPWHPAIEQSFADVGVTKATWKALIDAVFPAAKSVDSVILALSYCKARKLDPFKRPVHIVPVWSSAENRMIDTVWPGISELRTTAVRTGTFAGCDAAEFGPDITKTFTGEENKKQVSLEMTFPEWCQVTVYRMIDGQRVAITGPRVYWEETYATVSRWSEIPNAMWRKRKRGQIEKCGEAAALRRAFPEELGSEYAAEEVSERFYAGTTIEATALDKPKPAQNASAALDGLVKKDAVRTAGAKVTDVEETPHDPETGEVIDQQTADAGEAAMAEDVSQQIEQEDQSFAVAEETTGKLITGLADPELKTAADLDELKARAQDIIKSFDVSDEQKSVLLGRFNNEFLTRKRKLGTDTSTKGKAPAK